MVSIRRVFLFAIISITPYSTFSQELVNEIPVDLPAGFRFDVLTLSEERPREAYPVWSENGDMGLFLIGSSQLYINIFNEHFDVKNQIIVDRPKGGTYHSMIGGVGNGEELSLFFTTENGRSVSSITVNIEDKSYRQRKGLFKTSYEQYLESIALENVFYYVTLSKIKPMAYVYKIKNGDEYEKLNFDLSKFIRGDHLYKIFEKAPVNSSDAGRVEEVAQEAINSLGISAATKKMYYYDNRIIVTLDNRETDTIIIELDLESESGSFKYVQKPAVDCPPNQIVSNSYLLKNVLVQGVACKKGLNIIITDLNSDERLQSFEVGEEGPIEFANTPIYQDKEGDLQESDNRKIVTFDEMLKKISKRNLSIAVNEYGNKQLEFTIGSYLVEQTPSISSGVGGFRTLTSTTPYGSFNTYYLNPVYNSYYNYDWSKSIYFKSLINRQDFSHVPGEIQETVFDRIKKFQSDLNEQAGLVFKIMPTAIGLAKEDVIAETVFTRENVYYYGFYDRKNKVYRLLKFD